MTQVEPQVNLTGFFRVGISERFEDSLNRYIFDRIETGGFLRAVLENDLSRAIKTADPIAYRELPNLIDWLLEHAPSNAWGDKEKVAAWLAKKET